jgi:hypothetical protein
MEIILAVLAAAWMSNSLMIGLSTASFALQETQLQAYADDLAYAAAEHYLSGRSWNPGTAEWPAACKLEVHTVENSSATQVIAICGEARQVLWIPNTALE